MKNSVLTSILAFVLLGCATTDNGVRISKDKAPAPAPAIQPGRTEPIFYNGKTYTLKFSPLADGVYALSVLGMSAKQQKDSTNVATSAIRYFACPDGKTGKLVQQPRYIDGAWHMTARCG